MDAVAVVVAVCAMTGAAAMVRPRAAPAARMVFILRILSWIVSMGLLTD
jgi:hypothetical protein